MKLMFNIYMTINIIMNLKVIITFSLLFFICNIFAQNDLSTWTLIKKAEQTEIYADFKGLKKKWKYEYHLVTRKLLSSKNRQI